MPEETLEQTHLHTHKNVSGLQLISFPPPLPPQTSISYTGTAAASSEEEF